MQSMPLTPSRPADRWAYLWLAIGLLLGFFSIGQSIIPVAAWLSPLFALRFLRTQPVARGFAVLVVASMVVNAVAAAGMTPFPFPINVGFIALQVLVGSLPLLADRLLAPRLRGLLSTLVYPLAVTGWEFINLTTSPLGSFGSLAYTQYGNLALMQLASLTGVWGLTFLISWFAAIGVWAWQLDWAWRSIRQVVVTYAALLLLVWGYGYTRLLWPTPPTTSVRAVGLTAAVHPLPDVLSLWQRDRTAFRALTQENHASYLAATEREARAGAQLIAWPEGAGIGNAQDVAALVARGQALARQQQIYLALPVFILFDESTRPAENRLILIEPSGAVVLDHVKYGGNFLEGTLLGSGELQQVATPWGVLTGVICWDADFVGVMRQVGWSGADLLVVTARDWPGVASIHAQMAVFRAIENGVALLRVTDEGLSIAADPYGRVLAVQDYFTTTDRVLLAQLPTQAGVFTLYPLIGDVVGWGSVVGFLAVVGWIFLRRRQQRSRLSTSSAPALAASQLTLPDQARLDAATTGRR